MFLREPNTPEAAAYLDAERADTGYVMNLERAWAWRPDLAHAFVALRKQLASESALAPRELAVLVCATARTLRDAYCSLAWGTRLAGLADPALAGAVLRGEHPTELTAREAALARWAATVARDANATTSADVGALRTAGLSEREIFEATLFVALRLAFSTVNDALGAQPDRELVAAAPREVREAVDYGRAPAA